MYELAPFNAFPFNAHAVNAGFVRVGAAIVAGVATFTGGSYAEVDVAASVDGVATASADALVVVLFSATVAAEATITGVPIYLYNDGLPLILTDWDSKFPVVTSIVTLER